ncbi:MAG: universal stress protein [Deltaproteobacteria bacterium]|nr:universal stress protein [Deltaproteobacteria bacterium]MBW2017597.1 universal stress protein [Deltaproteobacteria bacterium]MBW2129087.1 universal stress protein [Deltaproteobacteria bacterium]MBW2304999.1 universal stress protein [Deltaproteobacteria bacterium]
MRRRILVALDDSENAMRAVEYVADTFSPKQEVTLFSVLPDTAAICDMNSPELTPYFRAEQGVFCALEDKKKELLKSVQEKAKKVLLGAGFQEDNITLKLETKKKGIARDIVNEAGEGYDTVVMGRRGISGLKEFFLGSISQKVLSLSKDFSILLVN